MSEAPENPSEFESSERFWGGFGRAGSGREGPRRTSGNGPPQPEGPPPQPPAHEHQCLEWCPICRTAEVLRGTTPDEVREGFTHVQHDALVALRAVLNSYIERLEQDERRGARPVEDIPIE
jgi:hypothetical protein